MARMRDLDYFDYLFPEFPQAQDSPEEDTPAGLSSDEEDEDSVVTTGSSESQEEQEEEDIADETNQRNMEIQPEEFIWFTAQDCVLLKILCSLLAILIAFLFLLIMV